MTSPRATSTTRKSWNAVWTTSAGSAASLGRAEVRAAQADAATVAARANEEERIIRGVLRRAGFEVGAVRVKIRWACDSSGNRIVGQLLRQRRVHDANIARVETDHASTDHGVSILML
ncbi:MAG TPA: hypothetical protein PKJ16_18275 [Spirochaetota bacterium]|nr:hypothetical protein [Spirochaetota bacterium]